MPSTTVIAMTTMVVETTRTGIPLKCKKCEREWVYFGKSSFYASCASCHRSVSIKENKVLEVETLALTGRVLPQAGFCCLMTNELQTGESNG